MSITEVLLVVSAVVNVLTILLAFGIFIYILNVKNQIQHIYQAMSTVLMKLFTLEQLTSKIGNSFADFIKLTEDAFDFSKDPKNVTLYKTTDGKYSAKTIDELIDKIKKDGSGEEYFNDEELDKLKRLFDNEDDDDLDNDEE
jgi:hypothetical protein